jgi:hypothetical protein
MIPIFRNFFVWSQAGYCLYSSTTILVFSLGGGTHGFTLDPTINEFVLTHPNMKIPKRGNVYSCNEAYSESWDENFKRYLKTIKTGTGQTGQRYTQRYIGSMVGDVSRFLHCIAVFRGSSNNYFPATFFANQCERCIEHWPMVAYFVTHLTLWSTPKEIFNLFTNQLQWHIF